MVAVLLRMCCRWVIVLSSCCRHKSRLRAVLESCTNMWGWFCWRIVRPNIVACISAVLTFDLPVPIFVGTYVVLARSGMVGLFIHWLFCVKFSMEQSIAHRTADAVMIGGVFGVLGSVYPPSTAIISGHLYCLIFWMVV